MLKVGVRLRPWVFGLSGGLLLALGWWLFQGDSGAGQTASAPPSAQQPTPSPTHDSNDPVALLALDRGDVLLQTLLLPDGRAGAVTTSVRMGLAQVSAEDAASYRDWLAGGSVGAGPADPTALATVERWVNVPATRRTDGVVEVGPFSLPAAHRYDLLAMGEDNLHVYMASFTRDSVPATIGPTPASGLRIHSAALISTNAQVFFRRTAERPDAEKWQAVMQQQAPGVLAAFGDEPLTLSATAQTFVPLTPEVVEVQLLIDGIEAERQTVTLKAGAISDVWFDPIGQSVAQAVSVDLRLSLIGSTTGLPIENVRVVRQGEQGQQERVSDESGRVNFSNLDRQRVQHFELMFPVSADELPAWPESMPLEVSLEARDGEPAAGRVVERSIELTPLEWLLLRTGALPKESARQVGNPYPIFVLQQQGEDGLWRDGSSDYFRPVPEGLAVSVSTRGRFRVMAAISPWNVHLSTPADTTKAAPDGKYRIAIAPETGHRVELLFQRDGIPLTLAPMLFQGPARGLPPRTLITNSQGRLRLDEVTRDEIVVEIPGSDEVRVDVRRPAAVVTLQAAVDAG